MRRISPCSFLLALCFSLFWSPLAPTAVAKGDGPFNRWDEFGSAKEWRSNGFCELIANGGSFGAVETRTGMTESRLSENDRAEAATILTASVSLAHWNFEYQPKVQFPIQFRIKSQKRNVLPFLQQRHAELVTMAEQLLPGLLLHGDSNAFRTIPGALVRLINLPTLRLPKRIAEFDSFRASQYKRMESEFTQIGTKFWTQFGQTPSRTEAADARGKNRKFAICIARSGWGSMSDYAFRMFQRLPLDQLESFRQLYQRVASRVSFRSGTWF